MRSDHLTLSPVVVVCFFFFFLLLLSLLSLGNTVRIVAFSDRRSSSSTVAHEAIFAIVVCIEIVFDKRFEFVVAVAHALVRRSRKNETISNVPWIRESVRCHVVIIDRQ